MLELHSTSTFFRGDSKSSLWSCARLAHKRNHGTRRKELWSLPWCSWPGLLPAFGIIQTVAFSYSPPQSRSFVYLLPSLPESLNRIIIWIRNTSLYGWEQHSPVWYHSPIGIWCGMLWHNAVACLQCTPECTGYDAVLKHVWGDTPSIKGYTTDCEDVLLETECTFSQGEGGTWM